MDDIHSCYTVRCKGYRDRGHLNMARTRRLPGRTHGAISLRRLMFEKVLVANRGEIAIRVMRTLKEMGIASVGVYSEADRETPHVREADEAFLLGPAMPAESYLSIEKIIEVAKEAGRRRRSTPATASWPRTPPSRPRSRRPGSSSSARPPRRSRRWARRPAPARSCRRPGVPIVPGSTEPSPDVEAARKVAEEIGYPVACKAAGGGGGKGFRVAHDRRTISRRRSRAPPARARSSSPTTASTSSATSRTRATSRSRCSPTRTATSSTSASATARSSAATRS